MVFCVHTPMFSDSSKHGIRQSLSQKAAIYLTICQRAITNWFKISMKLWIRIEMITGRAEPVSGLLKNWRISAPWAARDVIETSRWSISKTVLHLRLRCMIAIIFPCLFQFYSQDGISSYCSIQMTMIHVFINLQLLDELN